MEHDAPEDQGMILSMLKTWRAWECYPLHAYIKYNKKTFQNFYPFDVTKNIHLTDTHS